MGAENNLQKEYERGTLSIVILEEPIKCEPLVKNLINRDLVGAFTHPAPSSSRAGTQCE